MLADLAVSSIVRKRLLALCRRQPCAISHELAACRGHASEKPELPRALAAHGITFLGPPEAAMAALGDKVGSTILAQSARVPTLPWSGSAVMLPPEQDGHASTEVPADVYAAACVTTAEEAVASCDRIGYPAMLKVQLLCLLQSCQPASAERHFVRDPNLLCKHLLVLLCTL